MPTTIPVSIASLRSLKNALLDYFPNVKSSHLSEALAVGLGFNTNAALNASIKRAPANMLLTLDSAPLIQRLQEFRYDLAPAFDLANISANALKSPMPEQFRLDMARLLELVDAPGQVSAQERATLRRRCATTFGQIFGLGNLEPREPDENMIKQLKIGIDYKACQPGWGGKTNRRHSLVHFPGTDHAVFYFEKLPLADGKYIEYCTAVVSMPYLDTDGKVPKLIEAQELASRLGWTCEVHKEWSWHMAGVTTLVLFRRLTPHHEMLHMWSSSFKRWLYENKGRLTKGNPRVYRYVIEDILDCSHFPLNATSYDDCRGRYLKEFAPQLFHGMDESMADNFKRLFEKWQFERKAN